MREIEFAEFIADILRLNEEGLDGKMKEELCKARKNIMCHHSKIGEYKCSVTMPFANPFSIDTCLQSEIFDLWKNGIITTGSCCGHGTRQGVIQVSNNSVDKMLSLGYELVPSDEFGNGRNCFKPKTIL